MTESINEIKSLIRACPICNFKQGEVLRSQSFSLPEGHILPSSYDVVMCTNCSFVFADTSATQKDYDLYYSDFSKYEDTQISSGSGTEDWEKTRFIQVIDALKPFIKKDSAILDFGCANGGLLIELKQSGYNNLTGVDATKKCVSYIKNLGFNAYLGNILTYVEMGQLYDCIVLSHVFEHIYDLEQAMILLQKYLTPEGIIYVEVPDASSYKNYFIVPYYFIDCEHINHFDENALNNLFLPFDFELLICAKKEMKASSETLYPAIYAIYQKTPLKLQYSLRKDYSVRESLLEHLSHSEQKEDLNYIESLSKTQKPVIVWGAGQNTLRLLSNSSLIKCNIVSFIDMDQNKQGKVLNKVIIRKPEFIKESNHKGSILISSAVHSQDILKEIEAMGISNEVIVLH